MPRPASAAALLAFAACLAVCLAGCGDALGPFPAAGRPRELAYEAFGWPDYSMRVTLVGDTVALAMHFYGPQGPTTREARRVPSADEWRAFWAAVGEAGVRAWPRRCVNTRVQDGGGYDFALAWDGGRKAGSYTNASPTRAGRCSDDDSDDSARFQAAVLDVAGGPVLGYARGPARTP